MTFQPKEPTATSLVMLALVNADDFMTMAQLKEITGLDSNHVSAALYSLKKYSAANCIEQDRTLWWFATAEDDTRCRVIEERRPESRPRKPRRIRQRRRKA